MAERRMFAKTIIDSDAFLDMPLSSQCLYFHLSMRADDEGFINNAKKIMRMIGCNEDDMKLLATKKFIIPFETGIVVIKHWRIHNYIRGDRLVTTKYLDERNTLCYDENGAYTRVQTDDYAFLPESSSDCSAKDKRKIAYANSSLPYSFTYKMRGAFNGRVCPVCNVKMSTSQRNRMPTVQHNIPISAGGEHELDNISIICLSCNTSIRDKETEELNNKDVIFAWDEINRLEKSGIDWFFTPNLIWDRQTSGKCQADDGQTSAQDRIGKDSIGKVSIDNTDSRESDPVSVPKKKGIFQEFAAGDKALLDALREYNEYRNKKKKPLTDGAKTRLCKRLVSMFGDDHAEMISAIYYAIDKGWMDIYKPKEQAQPQQKATTESVTESHDIENLKRYLESLRN